MPPQAVPPTGRLRQFATLCLQVALLSLLFAGWLAVGQRWRLPLPAGLLSMLTLLGLLLGRVLPLSFVQRGAAFLLRYIALLFVPICVGAVRQLPALRGHVVGYITLVVAGALAGQMTAGLLAQALCKKAASTQAPEGFAS